MGVLYGIIRKVPDIEFLRMIQQMRNITVDDLTVCRDRVLKGFLHGILLRIQQNRQTRDIGDHHRGLVAVVRIVGHQKISFRIHDSKAEIRIVRGILLLHTDQILIGIIAVLLQIGPDIAFKISTFLPERLLQKGLPEILIVIRKADRDIHKNQQQRKPEAPHEQNRQNYGQAAENGTVYVFARHFR